ncbi:pimeloyl-ACP methyl ester carboxylesterase [Chitinophaga skermanii]|uniref:Pimeloyl-ACP methyl ester carboxylesterase n=2 Tax=Chitinophaga skermanii TaxID=331697 RepID=A0A327QX97_9BACT|nr:pimeloyl-ACP methyl ester carboxylesterase [Chitinophaga skermanii]
MKSALSFTINFINMKKIISLLLSTILLVFFCSFCTNNDDSNNAKTNTYVLVHGAWQAPYVWDAVRADLESKGNKVIVVELPGHGSDQTPTHTISLEVYRNKVTDAISKAGGQVILVGHSMGGMVITTVAEQVPATIKKLVYIGAFIPVSGQSLGELAMTDPGSQLGPQIVESADHLTLDVKRESLTNLFIGDGSPAMKDLVMTNYRPEPAIPFGNKVTLTVANFGAVDKAYIKTANDIVISPSLQDKMIASAGIKNVYSVNTSHSPFLSQPQAVSALLLKIAQ